MWVFDVLYALGKILAIFCIYIVGKWLYNIFLHPLRRYPGPIIAAASRIPLSYVTARGEVLPWHQKLHEKYGDVVRVGPTELSYINGQAWNDIYGRRPPNASPHAKDQRFFKGVTGKAHSMVSTPDDHDHARVRKIFSTAFSEAALRKQEPLFRKYVDLLIRNVKKEIGVGGSKLFNIVQLFNFATFDIMSDLTFGEPLSLVENLRYSPWVLVAFESIKALTFFRILAYFPPLQDILWFFVPESLKAQKEAYLKFAADRVDRRLTNKRNMPDIWNLVLTQGGDNVMSLDEMHSNATMFMAAGTETTATLLSGLMYLLLKNPQSMEILTEEIRGTFAEEKDMKFETLANLSYLNACIKEALRVYPPAPSGIPRVAPQEGTWICGKWVPGGTGMYISQYVCYHSPMNFKHPNKFIPERWMGDPEFAQDNRDAMQAFSVGPRNCLGQSMAYHEMRLLFALLLWHFNLELDSKCRNWMDQLVFTLWEKPPLTVTISPAPRD